ncbi:hypothetical protein [Acinetobacter puyangensis]|uniref:hypothetical protein n=1 Tax=Acinetobacter puyangensis TaxID=1096779 RepID=UPI003A4D9109
MNEAQIKMYENIAKDIHSKGVESLQGGNPCSNEVALLYYVENMIIQSGSESALVSALSDDLDKHNQDCIETLREMGDDVHGY